MKNCHRALTFVSLGEIEMPFTTSAYSECLPIVLGEIIGVVSCTTAQMFSLFCCNIARTGYCVIHSLFGSYFFPYIKMVYCCYSFVINRKKRKKETAFSPRCVINISHAAGGRRGSHQSVAQEIKRQSIFLHNI